MFCEKCGVQMQDGWKCCPNCSEKGVANPVERTREDLKEELNSLLSEGKQSAVLVNGTWQLSKDLIKLLDSAERLRLVEHVSRKSIIRRLKLIRMREYVVCTDKRFIYIEKADTPINLLPFLTKVIIISNKDISNIRVGKRAGIFTGTLEFNVLGKTTKWLVVSQEAAMKIKQILEC
jgi:hypothetical protein